MGANIGPQVYVFNFTTVGIAINGGHEAMVGSALPAGGMEMGVLCGVAVLRHVCVAFCEAVCRSGRRMLSFVGHEAMVGLCRGHGDGGSVRGRSVETCLCGVL